MFKIDPHAYIQFKSVSYLDFKMIRIVSDKRMTQNLLVQPIQHFCLDQNNNLSVVPEKCDCGLKYQTNLSHIVAVCVR